MGAYLSEPNKDTHSTDEDLAHLIYGASSMQGWRVTQEDAHNCIPKFDDNTSLFAVYDGHGGAEVAQYSAMHLPEFIKSVPAYKSGNLAQALEDAFLGFDSEFIKLEVIEELNKMIGEADGDGSDAENEVDHLFAEANMPLHEVLAKYQGSGDATAVSSNPALSHLKNSKPQSPCLRAKQNQSGDGAQNHVDDGTIKSAEEREKNVSSGDKDVAADVVNGVCDTTDTKPMKNADGGGDTDEGRCANGDNQCTTTIASAVPEPSSTSDCGKDDQPSCSSGSGCKGQLLAKSTRGVVLDDDSEETSNSEEDESYEEGTIPYADDSDSDDDDDDDELENSGNADEDQNDEEDDDDGSDDDDDDDEDDFIEQEKAQPGYDSGCTAVVALLRGSELYVANAGDSRCIVCRNGKAIDMSVDHKPEDEVERKRIVNAGGEVTEDRRVNGGLNLSRAIGDHAYKRNPDVALKDQMITALPDIRTLTIDPEEDEFMVLACDGIWNSMTSQQVADFVRERLKDTPAKLSSICEMMFENCLSPHSKGDGTGCDNMTAVIIKFKKLDDEATKGKRGRDTDGEPTMQAKRVKAEETDASATTEANDDKDEDFMVEPIH